MRVERDLHDNLVAYNTLKGEYIGLYFKYREDKEMFGIEMNKIAA